MPGHSGVATSGTHPQPIHSIHEPMKTLRDLFLDELADIYDAERRMVKALPKMAKAATCNDLKAVFQTHLVETAEHVKTVERVFDGFGAKARGNTCEATKGLIEEADELAGNFKGSPAINAALISVAQKVEHYEMASYGCLREWAALLGNPEAAKRLQGILDEESASNEAFTKLARTTCNKDALGTIETPRAGKRLVRPLVSPRRLVRPMAGVGKGARALL